MVFKRNFSTGGAAVEIVDALDSTATDKALSANQGRALNVAKSDTTHNHDADYADIAHVSDVDNPHSVDAADVGLGNVDNTADVDKPISSATQSALNLKSDITHNHDTDYATKASEHTHSNKAILDNIIDSGDGSKYLADDGTYVTTSGGGAFVQDAAKNAIRVAEETGIAGGARGYHAGDGQLYRTVASRVASGDFSGIGFGGRERTASGDYSGVGQGGYFNVASGDYSGVGQGGKYALAAMYGESAHGADKFSTQGDAQRGHLMFRGAPGSGDTDVEIFLYGASNSRFVLQNYDAYLCEVSFIGNSNAAGITYFAGQRRFLASRQGSAATTAITGLETIGTDIGSSGAVSFVANTSDGSIRCMVNSGTASVAYDFLVDIKYTKVRNA